ncbi:FxLYD domain-containing protein [Streptococcus merionis]|uniref:FxLYD domain-containing protein n=1 Tax=Streptococcus merionis TaxID=400065 RepID=UPI003513CADA
MKKLIQGILAFLVLFLVVGCASGNQTTSSGQSEEKVYDSEFLASLGEALESRWAFSDSTDFSESADNYEKLVQSELDKIEDYASKKFKDTQLQELAISYINELKKGIEVADSYGVESFYLDWHSHQNRRTELLTKINDLSPIVVKDESLLKELLAQGKEVESESKKDQDIKDLVSTITFTQDVEHSDAYTKWYVATVRNTTEYDIGTLGLTVNVINADGVTVETAYANAANWKKGSENFFEVMVTTGQNFERLEVHLEYYTAE